MPDKWAQYAAPAAPVDKWSQYAQPAAPAQPSTNGATIGATPDTENPLTNYIHQAGEDLTQGGSRTFVGKSLGFLQGRSQGYSGLNSGVSPGAANILGSPLTGTAQALEGVASIPQHPIGGPIKAVGGALKAATIPGMMMGGPETAGLIDAIPSAKYAGQSLNDISSAVGDVDVPLGKSLAPLQRLAELNARGGSGSVPAGVMQLLERSQAVSPMVYPEARDFASNISSLSGLEKMAAKPQVLSQMNALRSGMHQDIASSIGDLGPNYLDAIKEYAQAQQMKQTAGKIGKAVGGAAAAGIVGKEIYGLANKLR